MERTIFSGRFHMAAERVMEFTPKFVINELPAACLYLLCITENEADRLRASNASLPVTPVFNGLRDEFYIGPWTEEQVVTCLWQDGSIPAWVNMHAHSTDGEYTYIEVVACSRYVIHDDMLYHQKEGIPPFHVLGPNLPPNWKAHEPLEKFDLHWRFRLPWTAS